MQALYRGPLVVRDGCVLIGSPGEYTVPIWPKNFTAERDGSDRVIVRDADGSIVATEGQAFEMGGGCVAEFRPQDKVEPRQDQLRRVEASLGYSIPGRCVASEVYGVWSVGEREHRPDTGAGKHVRSPSPTGVALVVAMAVAVTGVALRGRVAAL